VLAVVQAGGQGSRMDVLTRERAKPALPYAGTYRLIDFILSSLAHTGIRDVWVDVQFQAVMLERYLAGGRPWDLDRTRGGLRLMPPAQGSGPGTQSGFAFGNADGLYRLRDEIEDHGAGEVIVASCDHVLGGDLEDLVTRHRAEHAEMTVLTAGVGVAEARNNILVTAGADGWIRSVEDKPEDPDGTTVATEVFVFDRAVLLEQLDELRQQLQQTAEGEDTGLGDLADHVLPAFVGRGRALAVPVAGYWKDLGRPEAYLQAHRDLVRGRVDVFDDPDRPVLSAADLAPPAVVRRGARVSHSMLSPGCEVRGEVVGSVLGRGVVVQAGASVVDSVLFDDVVVGARATVGTAVVDERVRIGRGARVGAASGPRRLRAEDVTLVGADARVRGGADVLAGGRMEPGSST
jgi:glucose-1-phosphate adenylyltransferase